jgi:asparagine synthase (glutamine-hydrolysing)
MPLYKSIRPFPPGHYWKDGVFRQYLDVAAVQADRETMDLEQVCTGIRERLTASVEARMDADAPLGFLLSGGLDSSLVCGISARLTDRPIRTFAIGMDTDPIDLKYAQAAADYIGADHTAFTMTKEEVLAAVPEVVRLLGTWDITTVRASIGMYLCCKKIRETTDIRVLMTGEISDELFGYKYTDFAPSAEAFQGESQKRIREIHMYDVLRADRCISVNSMEGRVPFGDTVFVQYVMAIDPARKMNTYGLGKYLLRHAFEGTGILPDEILWREKAAFSDAVGHSMVDDLKEHAETLYSDAAFEAGIRKYDYCTPFTKESLWYRDLFEEAYPGQAQMIKDFWMPNKDWAGCAVDDPSARVLANYGASGR